MRTLDQLIAYLTAYRDAHPDHAALGVFAEADGQQIIAALDGELVVRSQDAHGEALDRPRLAFVDTDR
jgi:hypothetical protein